MSLILNIETATTVCSVSLAKGGILLALKEQNGDYTHAENLTSFIEDVLSQAGKKLSELDAIAVSKGPGSYTGLRIGVSTAKGLCYSLDKPLIAVDTLKHLSLQVSSQSIDLSRHHESDRREVIPSATEGRSSRAESRDEGRRGEGRRGEELTNLFCPMIDARRMEVYCAIYDAQNNCLMPTVAMIIDESSFGAFLSPLERDRERCIFFFGDGAAKCRSVLSQHANAVFIDDVFPSAKDMITLSEQAFNNKQFEDVAYFEPFYLKDFVAGKKKGG